MARVDTGPGEEFGTGARAGHLADGEVGDGQVLLPRGEQGAGDVPVGAGRVLADGLDCAYIADVAVHPDHQGRGLGKAIIQQLVAFSQAHKKIILYANPGTEGFYTRLGFLRMNTAMAIWHDPARAIESGLLSARP